MDQIIVTIIGRVGSGKSPVAMKVFRALEESGKRVELSDHELFSYEHDFAENHLAVRERLKATGADAVIIVIGTGVSEIPFQIKVEPGIVAPLRIADAFMEHYGKSA